MSNKVIKNKDDNVKPNLIYINTNFRNLADSITKIETWSLSLYDSIQNAVNNVNIIMHIAYSQFYT